MTIQVILEVRCKDCEHEQESTVLDPVLSPDQSMLLEGLLTSTAHYCDKCDSSNVEHTTFRVEKVRHLTLIQGGLSDD